MHNLHDAGKDMTLVGVLIGGAIGFLGSVLLSWIKQIEDRRSAKIVLWSVLSKLLSRLSAGYLLFESKLGPTLTKDRFLKILERARQEDEHLDTSLSQYMKSSTPYETFIAHAAVVSSAPVTPLSLKRFYIPYGQALLQSVSLLRPRMQVDLFWVVERLRGIDEDIDRAEYQVNLTYSGSTSPANHAIAVANYQKAYLEIRDRTRSLIEKLEDILMNP